MYKVNWTPSDRFCASSAHMGWATAVVLAATYHGWLWWEVVIPFLVFAFFKEYWADAKTFLPFSGWLENDSIPSSTVDFLTYSTGLIIGSVGVWSLGAGLALAIALLVIMVGLDKLGAFNWY